MSRAAWVAVAVAGLVLAGVAWLAWSRSRERRRADRAALVADTLRAALDTSRALSARERAAAARVLGDSLAGATRLVVQLRQESDALDRALGTARTANAQLTATVARLRASVTSTDTVRLDSAGARVASFRLRQPPYTIAAVATLPTPPEPARLDVDVALDSVAIALRLGCSRDRTLGVRSATATATGPTWVQLAVGRVEQSPEVCNPAPPTVARLAWWRRCAPTILLGYGVVLSGDGRSYHGPALAGGVDVLRCFR